MSDLRTRAAGTAAAVAERLADPDRVLAVTCAPSNMDGIPGEEVGPPWHDANLSCGPTGLALLFAALEPPGSRVATHRFLSVAVAGLRSGGHGLFGGPVGIGLTASYARDGIGGYERLLSTIDRHAAQEVHTIVATERRRLRSGGTPTTMVTYDLVNGITGVGAYLLGREARHREALVPVLEYLVALSRPVSVDGHEVPGWWAYGSPQPFSGKNAGRFRRGHFNVGVAHGIAGPLSLLALAELAGVRVAGQTDAILTIGRWLRQRLSRTAGGASWPTTLTWDEELAGGPQHPPDDRAAWCYGTPGVARAMVLAARAAGRAEWAEDAAQLFRQAVEGAERGDVLTDDSLCHGWAGLLTLAQAILADTGLPGLDPLVDRLVQRLVDGFDSAAPFGYRYRHPDVVVAADRPGFLEGAAGIALALTAYAQGGVPAGGWARALLIS